MSRKSTTIIPAPAPEPERMRVPRLVLPKGHECPTCTCDPRARLLSALDIMLAMVDSGPSWLDMERTVERGDLGAARALYEMWRQGPGLTTYAPPMTPADRRARLEAIRLAVTSVDANPTPA